MEIWIGFWRWSYIIGLSAFFALAIILIPLGVRDLFVLFRQLGVKDK